ncbi:EUKARYOTIC TRANSLATION INITIATION FACTOR 4A [Encephalitozoon cuniculi GB-M1]|uniref:ATP-dependent RNA helicase eIF4A n=2 Tax=Encephalitozoon cuniculi TaxID=6035 RepID=IF4A_ENCCU|nr:ATP-dependent RNA helicase [Encephalitozoon cuniculi GB-M1]Q8SQM5.1 RecName: Full=ATP-dependent RNA helicase eIF4A; AltName: Full=Eukaryotic initiation factor 4A; Short=eIF-4A; AltName: Full=Translation initiation factor 1 [Encephalitozoon cuniculi GB-M1]AGE96505.1 eukaryotic translation initiation factor 4a [Encephalitozoon cuniculi]KMV65387.1 ATP-dependent RNA helicase [Encephalitozoon cuniculi EcunIII-L]CAD27090.1 EUKARYOTIC TRANSLATION INITIATION FACTOR 4A [Encephalitozoon cuniculi GB-M1
MKQVTEQAEDFVDTRSSGTEIREFEDLRSDSSQIRMFDTWEDYGLKEDLLKGIYSIGFETPSFIQKAAIQPIIDGRDIRAQAQSGTGKTGAFAVAALQICDMSQDVTQILVLASTREIAAQNAARFEDLGCFMGARVALLSGGSPIAADKVALEKKPHIVVGTPGRVEHMININELSMDNIKLFVIDEADEMLKAGFQEQVKSIFRRITNKDEVQIAMFSATYDEEELRVSEEILINPVIIDLRYNDQTLKGIRQYFIDLRKEPPFRKGREDYLLPKLVTLYDIFRKQRLGQSIVFINSKEDARIVYDWLIRHEWECELISAELTQAERERTLNRFRGGTGRCLISSGLLSRGIDIQNLSVVFCLDVPSFERKSTYIHRIGRSGRYGRKGIAINIVYEHELKNLKAIERFYNTTIKELPADFSFQ